MRRTSNPAPVRQLRSLWSGITLVALIFSCGAPPNHTEPKPLPETTKELFELGRAYAARGNYLKAEQYMSSALKAGYDHRAAIHTLLEVCLEGGFLRGGIAHANAYLIEHPNDLDVQLSLAALYYGVRDVGHAKVQLRRLHSIDPNRPNAHYLSGMIAYESGADGVETARLHWERYLELAPTGRRSVELRAKLRELQPPPKRIALPDVQEP